ncbi:hypothetical protein, partial [Brachymonas denitrificans]|uniref:hypothetical protein n=1 Tax=Brachymonas denitrificans TaxID=28220 RepID=UPI0032209928
CLRRVGVGMVFPYMAGDAGSAEKTGHTLPRETAFGLGVIPEGTAAAPQRRCIKLQLTAINVCHHARFIHQDHRQGSPQAGLSAPERTTHDEPDDIRRSGCD